MARRRYINNAPVTTLSASVTSVATTVPVTTAAGFPSSYPWTAIIDAGTASAEVVLVTSAAGLNLTVTRGYDGTSGQAHALGAAFAHVATQADYDEANAHVNATTGVHGATGAVVGTTDVQTLSGKTLTSPVITTPTISDGAASKLLQTGDVATAAVRAKAAATGRAFETQTSTGVVKVTIAGDTGNTVIPGTLASGALAVTGAASVSAALSAAGLTSTGTLGVTGTSTLGGNVTMVGDLAVDGWITCQNDITVDGLVTGGLTPFLFTNQAAVDASPMSVGLGTIVYLTAPTGGSDPGFFYYTGSGWKRVVRLQQASTGTITHHSGTTTDTQAVTFPTPFLGTPVVVVSSNTVAADSFIFSATAITTTGFVLRSLAATGSPPGVDHTAIPFSYIAIGQ